MLFKKGELKLLWPFYLYTLAYGLSTMIIPFFIIYFRNLDFSFFQIGLLTSVLGISSFLFEVPTGAFADSFSRKYSVIIGFFITALAVIIIPFTQEFFLLLVLWALSGMGMSFISGAEEAWVVDNLNYNKRSDLHHEYFIKNQSITAFGMIFAPFIGALLVKDYSVRILWFVLGFGFLLNAVILIVFAKEHYKPKKLKLISTLKQTYFNSKKSLKFIKTQQVVFLIVLAGLFIQLMFAGRDGWQPLFVSLGMQEHQLGYLYSIMAALVMVTSFLSKLFVNARPKNTISVIILINMALLLSLLFIHSPLFLIAAIIFLVSEGTFGVGAPIIQTYIHKFIPKKIRATVISTKSMFSSLIFALTFPIAGIFLDFFGQ